MTGFTATVEARPNNGIAIKIPFDPDREWGPKERHDITGTLAGCTMRGQLVNIDGDHYLQLGAAWCRDSRVQPGAHVNVEMVPEGPQVSTMARDVAAALEAEPDARRFFESLATFYRKNFVRWIDDAKRPETRARRIQETIATLKVGKRQR